MYDRTQMAVQAYTVGSARSYDEALDGTAPVTKTGRRTDYEGGWIWRTETEAFAFLVSDHFAAAFPGRDPTRFGVYRLELPSSWESDVSQAPDPRDGVHRLLNDALVVARV